MNLPYRAAGMGTVIFLSPNSRYCSSWLDPTGSQTARKFLNVPPLGTDGVWKVGKAEEHRNNNVQNTRHTMIYSGGTIGWLNNFAVVKIVSIFLTDCHSLQCKDIQIQIQIQIYLHISISIFLSPPPKFYLLLRRNTLTRALPMTYPSAD